MGSLNNIIAELIGRYSNEQRALWLKHSPISTPTTIDQDIFKVNHFLRIQLGLLEGSTLTARESLLDREGLSVWLKAFQEDVLPVVVERGLPVWDS